MFTTFRFTLSRRLSGASQHLRIAVKRNRPTSFICAVGTVLILIAATVFALKVVSSRTEHHSSGFQGVSADSSRLEAEHIVLTRRGFEPSTIRRPDGRVILMVDNRSGLPEIELQLDRVAGNRLLKTRISRETLDWIEVIDLTPGEYILTETGHPNWSCRFTISAR